MAKILMSLKTLEDDKFIYLHQNKKFIKDNCLYNTIKYKKDENGEYTVNEDIPNSIGHIFLNSFQINTDFGSYIQRFAIAIFYVSNALCDLVDNNFKTSEQIRHEQAMKKARIQVYIAWGAFFISLMTLNLYTK